jgi:uncharacterized membrane protein YdjX (TVP38/TMEM64 family)
MQKAVFLVINLLVAGAVAALMVAAFMGVLPLSPLKDLVTTSENFWVAGIALSILMFSATVIAPLATFFILPIAAGIIGPLASALFAVAGWFLGSLVAFLLTRHVGRPLLAHLVDEKKLLLYEKYIPPHLSIGTLVLLRMVVPPDILSYTMGIVSSIRFVPYALATLVGLLPYALIVAYAGAAFWAGDYRQVAVLVCLGIALFIAVWSWLIWRHRKRARAPSDALLQ